MTYYVVIVGILKVAQTYHAAAVAANNPWASTPANDIARSKLLDFGLLLPIFGRFLGAW